MSGVWYKTDQIDSALSPISCGPVPPDYSTLYVVTCILSLAAATIVFVKHRPKNGWKVKVPAWRLYIASSMTWAVSVSAFFLMKLDSIRDFWHSYFSFIIIPIVVSGFSLAIYRWALRKS